MGEGFVRFKKQNLIDAIVKSLLVCFTAALLVIAAFLILVKQGVFDFKVTYFILIGVAFGLLLGCATFFVVRLSDVRLARKLDRELFLKEKVQTMLAFKDDEGEMKLLQRQSTREILARADAPASKLVKGWIALFIAFAIALASFIVGMVLFLAEEEVLPSDDEVVNPGDDVLPPEDEEFEATDYQKEALRELIAYVEASKLQSDAKAEVLETLNLLLENMDTLGTDTSMRDYVVDVIKSVRGSVNRVNSTFAFRVCTANSKVEMLQNLSLALYSLDLNIIETEINSLNTTLFVMEGSRDGIAALKDEIGVSLTDETFMQSGELFELIKAFYNVLADIVDHPDYSDANVVRKLNEALTVNLLTGLKQIIPHQRTNEDVKVYVIEELMRIFGITEEDLAERKNEDGSVETEEPEERPEEGDDGGFGTGETLFGSNDTVIDPTKDPGADVDSTRVEYGDIIYENGYDQKANDTMINGGLSEDLVELLDKYFEILETPGK